MKVLAKVMESVGLIMLFIGGASMDSASLVIPIIMAFAGMAIAWGGVEIEEAYV